MTYINTQSMPLTRNPLEMLRRRFVAWLLAQPEVQREIRGVAHEVTQRYAEDERLVSEDLLGEWKPDWEQLLDDRYVEERLRECIDEDSISDSMLDKLVESKTLEECVEHYLDEHLDDHLEERQDDIAQCVVESMSRKLSNKR